VLLIAFICSWIWMWFRNIDNYRGSQFIIWLVVGTALAVKFRMRWECTAHRLYSCTVTGPNLMPLHIKRLLFIYYGMYLLIFFSFPSARKSPTFFFGCARCGRVSKGFCCVVISSIDFKVLRNRDKLRRQTTNWTVFSLIL
jgi:hypothetical protein